MMSKDEVLRKPASVEEKDSRGIKDKEITRRVLQKQYESNASNFHVGQIHRADKTFVWVYDCGNNDAAKQFDTPIDIIFVSHFHQDHVAGIKTLFDKNPTAKLYVPYLSEGEFFVQLWESGAVIDEKTWRFFQSVYFATHDIEADDPDLIRDMKRIFDEKKWQAKEPYGIWMFKTYTPVSDEAKTDIPSILSAIKQKLGIDDVKDLFKLDWSVIRNTFDEESKKIIKEKFSKGTDTNKQNRISMCLYTGPEKNCFFHFDRAGWLHTGDACLKNDEIYRQFYEAFKDYEEFIGTVVLPHHGSENNHNPNLLKDFNADHFVVAYSFRVNASDYSFLNEKLEETKNIFFETYTNIYSEYSETKVTSFGDRIVEKV